MIPAKISLSLYKKEIVILITTLDLNVKKIFICLDNTCQIHYSMNDNAIDFSNVNLDHLHVGVTLIALTGEREVISEIAYLSSSSGQLWTVTMMSGWIYQLSKGEKRDIIQNLQEKFTPIAS